MFSFSLRICVATRAASTWYPPHFLPQFYLFSATYCKACPVLFYFCSVSFLQRKVCIYHGKRTGAALSVPTHPRLGVGGWYIGIYIGVRYCLGLGLGHGRKMAGGNLEWLGLVFGLCIFCGRTVGENEVWKILLVHHLRMWRQMGNQRTSRNKREAKPEGQEEVDRVVE